MGMAKNTLGLPMQNTTYDNYRTPLYLVFCQTSGYIIRSSIAAPFMHIRLTMRTYILILEFYRLLAYTPLTATSWPHLVDVLWTLPLPPSIYILSLHFNNI